MRRHTGYRVVPATIVVLCCFRQPANPQTRYLFLSIETQLEGTNQWFKSAPVRQPQAQPLEALSLSAGVCRKVAAQMGRGRGVDREKNTKLLGCRDVKDATLADGTVLLVDADIREREEGRRAEERKVSLGCSLTRLLTA